MNYFKSLWIGVIVLVLLTVVYFFVGVRAWGEQAFAPNYAASMAGAGLGAALSLIVVMISFTITQRNRQKDLKYARFVFLKRRGEELWQAYVTFCEKLGADTASISGASWNSVDRTIWPDESKALELHKELKKKIKTLTNSPGGSTLFLRDAYDNVFASVSDTGIFEGEHSLAYDITEAWMFFGWNCLKVQDYQGKIGWSTQNWTDISNSIEQTSESVTKALACLGKLAAKVQIQYEDKPDFTTNMGNL